MNTKNERVFYISINTNMEYVYIIVENGLPYLTAYSKFEDAILAVKDKHSEYIINEIKQLDSLYDIEYILADINVPENTKTGITQLYIEKGINIEITKLLIKRK